MTSNLLVATTLILSSASWFTVHVALCSGLWARLSAGKRWLAILPPTAWLTVVWGLEHGLRLRSSIWAVCAVTYVTALAFAG